MKKLFLLLFVSISFNCINFIYAQSLSIEETKSILYSNKWFLRRLEQDGKMYTVPKEIQGLKMVFKSNGTMYSYLPSGKESASEIWTWSITKKTLLIQKSSGQEINEYVLKDFIGYKLYLTAVDDDEMPTFVFEMAEKIADAVRTEKGAIGQQVWTTENLNTDRFRNGDLIAEAKTDKEWEKAGKNGQPAWCYYNDKPKYGKLYNWYAINDLRGLAPQGWHIPSREEVEVLVNFLGGKDEAAKKMKTTNVWITESGNTNSSGFSAMPGSHRLPDGTCMNEHISAYFWTTTQSSNTDLPVIKYGLDGSLRYYLGNLGEGCYVRCIKN